MKSTYITILIICCFLIPSPCKALEITSAFGWRVHPLSGAWKFHTGLDLGYSYGDTITALMDGTIVYSAPWGGYGNTVIIRHTDDQYTLYAHCSQLLCNYGDTVKGGEIIAAAGATGNVTGPHLHVEYWKNGQYSDPLILYNK